SYPNVATSAPTYVGRMNTRIPLIFTLAAALLVLAAPGASAKIRVYKVTAEGSGSFSRYQDARVGTLGPEITRKATFSWKIVVPRIAFLDDGTAVIFGDGPGEVPDLVQGGVTGSGSETTLIHGLDNNTPVTVTGM